MARILGLDIGEKRIGVALSDPEGILASPFTIIEHSEDDTDIQAIGAIIVKQGVEKVIVGLPRSLSGSSGSQAEKVRSFAEKLRQAINVPMEYRDERLSTVSAEKLMRESRTKKQSRAKKPPVRVDAIAAAIILQGYLDEVRDAS